MTEYHEPPEELDARARDLHRALTSLKEEIEAVDWYGQREVCAANAELRSVLGHNRKEEIEHACMTLEWLRRECPEWDSALRTYLFQTGAIVEIEERAEAGETKQAGADQRAGARSQAHGLGVGSLREVGR
jgi:ferritin-like protein